MCITIINGTTYGWDSPTAWKIGLFINDQIALGDDGIPLNIISSINGDNFDLRIQNNSNANISFQGTITYTIDKIYRNWTLIK